MRNPSLQLKYASCIFTGLFIRLFEARVLELKNDDQNRTRITETSSNIRVKLLRQLPYSPAEPNCEDRIPLDSIYSEVCAEHGLCPLEEIVHPALESVETDKTFGCVIVCFNNEQSIADSIVSALNQTRPYDQIMVVNDASTDGTLQIAQAYANHYPNVSVLDLPQNVGVTAARHFGYLHLETDFVTQLDGDDCFWPTKNFHEAAILLQDESAIAFSDILILTPRKSRRLVSTAAYNTSSSLVAERLLQRAAGVPRDMSFSRQKYLDINGYDLRVPIFEDLDLKIRLALNGGGWKRSNATLGTIYDRRFPKLSRDIGDRTARLLTNFFFRFVDVVGVEGPDAAAAYHELTKYYSTEWTEHLGVRLAGAMHDEILKMKQAVLARKTKHLLDEQFSKTIVQLCMQPSFDSVGSNWQRLHGVGNDEAPQNRFDADRLFWQTSPMCGFAINSPTHVKGLKARVFLPHLAKQTLKIQVEQAGVVVSHDFVLDGKRRDQSGQHVACQLDIPAALRPGEAKIYCYAESSVDGQEVSRELYCLFADWQLCY